MTQLTLTSPGITHADLVLRAASWLRNRKRCRVVLTEQTTGTGEIPDALGWRYLTESILIECKVTRSDFFADRSKPFRCDPALGMGVYRFFMAPSGVLRLEDLDEKCPGWGLLEVRGRTIRQLRDAEPQPKHDESEEVAQLVQALAQTQMRVQQPLHIWLTGPESPVGQMRAQQKQSRTQIRERSKEAVIDHQRNRQWLIDMSREATAEDPTI